MCACFFLAIIVWSSNPQSSYVFLVLSRNLSSSIIELWRRTHVAQYMRLSGVVLMLVSFNLLQKNSCVAHESLANFAYKGTQFEVFHPPLHFSIQLLATEKAMSCVIEISNCIIANEFT